MPSYEINGLRVEAKVPTLAQLTVVKQAARGLQDYDACRSLVKGTAVEPSFVEIVRRRSGCIMGLATRIAQAAGVGGLVRILEEPEIEDEGMATAFVAQSEKFAGMYKDPEDERRTLYPVVVATEVGDERLFIIRRPLEVEVERYRKANTCEAAKLLCTKIAVWGDVESIERDLPGIYITIAEFALDITGDWEARRVGEA